MQIILNEILKGKEIKREGYFKTSWNKWGK